MDAKELRIGNYFLDENGNFSEMSGYYIHELSRLENNPKIKTIASKFKPIPLTEDLFEKLTSNFTKGVNRDGSLWIAFHNMHIGIYFHNELKYYYYHTNNLQSKPILFVHRFQNLIFELSDIELKL